MMIKQIASGSQGIGVGLRTPHFQTITESWPKMDWFEAITENFMDSGGRPMSVLEKVRTRYPVALHGTSLSIGSVDPLRPGYLKNFKAIVDRIDPFIVSDHLCWTSVDQEELHDLLPLPFTEESLKHIVSRVNQVQEFLGRQIILENVSSYVTYKHSVVPEWEFLREIARRSGCGILLDINNIYVNSFNHKFEALDFIQNIPREFVKQFHMAGHTNMGKYLFDTHIGPIIDPVWKLYAKALEQYGQVSTLIEWDAEIPEFKVLEEEAARARLIYQKFNNRVPVSRPTEPLSISSGPLPLSLSELERRMKNCVQPGREQLDCSLNDQGGDPGHARLGVYSNGYLARIYESVSDNFEAVRKIIGEKEFSKMSNEYAAKYPSTHYNLNYGGKFFPEYLEKHPLTKTFPFLPELAHLEWGFVELFDGVYEKPFDLQALASLSMDDWPKVRFSFQAHLFIYRASWPVLDIWRARNNQEINPEKNLKQNQDILLFRVDTEIRTRVMDFNECDLLQALQKGLSLGDACEKIDLPEEDSALIQEWFEFWASAGLITACVLPASAEKSG